MSNLTGNDIALIRETLLQWPRGDFGRLVGASPSAVFRWERLGAADARLDPRFREVLNVLRALLEADLDGTRALLEKVRDSSSTEALYMILGMHFDLPQHRRGGECLPWRVTPPPLVPTPLAPEPDPELDPDSEEAGL